MQMNKGPSFTLHSVHLCVNGSVFALRLAASKLLPLAQWNIKPVNGSVPSNRSVHVTRPTARPVVLISSQRGSRRTACVSCWLCEGGEKGKPTQWDRQ